jgi:hypothetical protein
MQVQLQSADQQVMRSSLMEQQQVQHQQGDMSVQLQQSPWRQSRSSGPSPAAGLSPAAAAVLCSSAVVSPQLLPSCLPAPPATLFQTAAGSSVSSLLGTGSPGLAVPMQQRSGAPASVQQLQARSPRAPRSRSTGDAQFATRERQAHASRDGCRTVATNVADG